MYLRTQLPFVPKLYASLELILDTSPLKHADVVQAGKWLREVLDKQFFLITAMIGLLVAAFYPYLGKANGPLVPAYTGKRYLSCFVCIQAVMLPCRSKYWMCCAAVPYIWAYAKDT
jgi:hypothetical protein